MKRPNVRALIVAVACLSARTPCAADDPVDFARDIQPILEKNCSGCHGAEKQRSSLRLDGREFALKGGEHGPAVIPGKSAQSLLMQAVTGTHDEIAAMPKGKERLSGQQIELLRRWIDAGAVWPADASARPPSAHWAFEAPARPEPPAVENVEWIRNPIDRFVLARLEKDGLAPSPEADRVTLARRLSLDIVGLPPRAEEVDAFVDDPDPGAYDKLVERLLGSPHHGERWGRHWLDAARYADSDGYEKDKPRSVWFYRDWVIDAISRDLPYDEFIIQQIAGDELPPASDPAVNQARLVATGFLRNSMINEEGGIDPEQFRMEAMFDRMDAIGKSILGLTIQCSQCHDHKFDPLTQEEYYRLFAYLNNDHEGNIAAYTPAEQRQRADVLRRIGEIEAGLRHQDPDWRERMTAWEDGVRGDQPEWIVLEPHVDEISTGGQKYLPLEDGSFLAQGYAPTKHTVKMTAKTDLEGITAFRVELLNDPNLPLGGPGRSIFGTCALTEFEVHAAPLEAPEKSAKVELARATADVEPAETPLDSIFDDKSEKRRVTGPVAFAIDGNDTTAWGIDIPGRRNQPRKAVFVAGEPVRHAGGAWLTFYLRQNHGGWNSDDNQNHNLGRFRLSVTSAPGASADSLPARAREVLAVPRDRRTPAQVAALFSHWRTTVPEWQEANSRIEALWKTHPAGSSQLVLESRESPRLTSVLRRGDFLKPTQAVTAAAPSFLHPIPADAPATRLTFAKWLVDRRSPTTARSIVNRVWQMYFGTGLVTTSEDLGTRSDPPSHPGLLDWLAVELMDSGWSLKALHRLIVESATYRQSSRASPELYQAYPDNRLLARGPRFRVEGEIVRDIALAASGLLASKLGGRSVYPPLPAFMLQPPVSYGPKTWHEETGPDRYRRAVYTFRYRSLPYPVLQTFDAPNGDFACVRRARSNTPLQALMTLNEPVFIECAQALALRALRERSNDHERVIDAFRRCLSRRPTLEETEELLGLLAEQKRHLGTDPEKAWEIAAPGAGERPDLPEGVTASDLAAWTIVSRVLLNLDETITKE